MSKQSEHDYYTAEEAMKVLGMKKSKFYDEIEEGKIPFDLPPGKRIGMRFPKEGIDTLAKRERERKKRSRKQTVHLSFEPSTPADVWTAVNNARRLYGPEDIISFERALEWRDINPDISMSVKQEKLLAGMVTYLPLDEQTILSLLRDDLRERDIPNQAIQQWTDPQLSVYVAGIASVETENPLVNSQRGRFLLRHAIKWAITLTAQYDIKNWYSIGVTPQGQVIAEALGFREIISLENGERKGYVLDHMLAQPTKLVRRYLRNMESQTSLET